jgi:hypothetical protein
LDSLLLGGHQRRRVVARRGRPAGVVVYHWNCHVKPEQRESQYTRIDQRKARACMYKDVRT